MSDSRLTRPVYILAHPADNAGCGYHRVIRPIQIMSRCGVALARNDDKVWPDDLLKLMKPDIVVWQRAQGDIHHANISRYRRALPDATFVYDIDDPLSAVPEASWHKPYVPYDVDAQMAKCIALCDILSVSTKPLASYMSSVLERYADQHPDANGGFTPGLIDIRVVPNMLGRDDFQAAAAARLRGRRSHPKPRVGWGGGISHSGDLALIKEVIERTADRVQWVFLGMQPEGVNAAIEFHKGVSPREYLVKLASLNLDLMVAPLEDHVFNRCKSNLRLVEAGACGYPVIASMVVAYTDGNPPVHAYADTAEAWVAAIDGWLALSPNQQVNNANGMKRWAERFCMDDRIEERAAMWLPAGRRPFKPRRNTAPAGLTIVCPQPSSELAELGDVQTSLARACASTGDVLYVAPDTKLTSEQIARLRAQLSGNTAAVSAVSNDGGLCGFPKPFSYCPLHPEHGAELDKMASEMFADTNVSIQFPSGPVTLISRRAIDACGAPEACEPGHEQEALIEWGLMVGVRNFQCAAAANVFATQTKTIQGRTLDMAVRRGQVRYPPPKNHNPDPLKQFRSELELAFHRERYNAPFVTKQSGYGDWSAYFDTIGDRDRDEMRAKVESLVRQNGEGRNIHHPKFGIAAPSGYMRVDPQTWPHHDMIWSNSFATAIEEAVGKGCDWLVFAREDATIREHALWMLAKCISENPDVLLIYSDHDFVDDKGVRHLHDFKPEFDLELLLGRDYITPFFAVRIDAMAPGGDAKISEATLYHLALVVASYLDRWGGIKHIPRILAHLKDRDIEAEKKAATAKIAEVNDVAKNHGWALKAHVHPRFPQYAEVNYLPPREQPLISIIIPTKDKLDMLQPCVDSLLKQTRYKNLEVLIVDNGSADGPHRDYIRSVIQRDDRVLLYSWPKPFNWAALNNWAAKQAHGEYVLFLNDDTRIVEPLWLDEMVGAAQRPHVGAVGARLLYPQGYVQHVGVVCAEGLTGHIHKGLGGADAGYNGYAVLTHESTAVTGACFLIKKQLLEEAGGIDEEFAHNFNDVALCMKLRRMGYRNVMVASATVQHVEGATRTGPMTEEGIQILWAEGRLLGKKFPEKEPYWNPNLIFVHQNAGAQVSGLNMDMYRWPALPWPWRDEKKVRERVLVIGDNGKGTSAEVREGNAIFSAQVDGYQLRIVQPPLMNTPPMDIRVPGGAKSVLRQLGIDRIVLRTIAGAPVELLPFLQAVEVPVTYVPITAEAACPRLNFIAGGKPCENQAQADFLCQECVAEFSSPFGIVSIEGWRQQWHSFLKHAEVKLSDVDDGSAGAIKRVYADEFEPAGAAAPTL